MVWFISYYKSLCSDLTAKTAGEQCTVGSAIERGASCGSPTPWRPLRLQDCKAKCEENASVWADVLVKVGRLSLEWELVGAYAILTSNLDCVAKSLTEKKFEIPDVVVVIAAGIPLGFVTPA